MGGPRSRANRFLPLYVSKFESQHGNVRYYFRKKPGPKQYFKSVLGTPAFLAEYNAFLNPAAPAAPVTRAEPGTLNELLDRYMSVPERLGPSAVTQQKITAILEDFREGRGDRPVAQVTFEAIDKIVAKKMVKTGTGNKTKGGLHAARKLRKELIRLFDFAIKAKMIGENPARMSEKVKTPAGERSHGFHTWTEEEITQYRDHHRLGTRERLAMELILWTDQRRSDVVKMGKAQIKNGRLPVEQDKTGETLWLAVPGQLLEAVIAMPPKHTNPFCFLITSRGKPFTKESFGNWFKKACVAAGLPHCTAHGLRKATLRRMAELQMSNKTMKSVSGQRSDKTLAKYIEKADQTRLADSAISQLAAWERSLAANDSDEKVAGESA
ncbi:tyrosine-type recombinase/integrase [Sphingobium yanoikuyae]|uniref:tyrosine-type recombinase/integrase n=1 Tax=Sphingobium yanoikuyae TaxID=13690 RepID=UPI002432B95A|nr:tyrosine-type recombinase/integrase [Sphingobium yanoikuyae]